MKVYNQKKLNSLKRLEQALVTFVLLLRYAFLPLHLIIVVVKKVAGFSSPKFLVVDGFLIGDAVLLRPLIKSVLSDDEQAVYIGGTHSKFIFDDFKIKIIFQQWPWANYDYSIGSLIKLLSLWSRLLWLTPEFCIEARGDFRSIAFCSLAWSGKIVSYAFTGGKKLLHLDASDSDERLKEQVFHLEEHNRALALALGLNYDRKLIIKQRPPVRAERRPVIGLSFSGSRPLKVLPLLFAERLLKLLKMSLREDVSLKYLISPNDFFLGQEQDGGVRLLKQYQVEFFKGNFEEYLDEFSTLAGYVGVDSAGAHIASMYDLPVLVCFNTMLAEYARPIHDKVATLELPYGECKCRPCEGSLCVGEHTLQCFTGIGADELQRSMSQFVNML
ncbi:MAG: hypothetical protein HQK50_01685 [Oligoflexia bacterium]|nr:hypothetical protein [Oligoflexia bacterium]